MKIMYRKLSCIMVASLIITTAVTPVRGSEEIIMSDSIDDRYGTGELVMNEEQTYIVPAVLTDEDISEEDGTVEISGDISGDASLMEDIGDDEGLAVLAEDAPRPTPVPSYIPSATPTPFPTVDPTTFPTATPTPYPTAKITITAGISEASMSMNTVVAHNDDVLYLSASVTGSEIHNGKVVWGYKTDRNSNVTYRLSMEGADVAIPLSSFDGTIYVRAYYYTDGNVPAGESNQLQIIIVKDNDESLWLGEYINYITCGCTLQFYMANNTGITENDEVVWSVVSGNELVGDIQTSRIDSLHKVVVETKGYLKPDESREIVLKCRINGKDVQVYDETEGLSYEKKIYVYGVPRAVYNKNRNEIEYAMPAKINTGISVTTPLPNVSDVQIPDVTGAVVQAICNGRYIGSTNMFSQKGSAGTMDSDTIDRIISNINSNFTDDCKLVLRFLACGSNGSYNSLVYSDAEIDIYKITVEGQGVITTGYYGREGQAVNVEALAENGFYVKDAVWSDSDNIRTANRQIIVSSNKDRNRYEVRLTTEEGIVARGSYEDVSWILDGDGKLTVTGNGDYALPGTLYSSRSPWIKYADRIIGAEINLEGVTDISGMFKGCFNMTHADLDGLDASGITRAENVFSGCDSLTSILIPSGVKQDINLPAIFCDSLDESKEYGKIPRDSTVSYEIVRKPGAVGSAAISIAIGKSTESMSVEALSVDITDTIFAKAQIDVNGVDYDYVGWGYKEAISSRSIHPLNILSENVIIPAKAFDYTPSYILAYLAKTDQSGKTIVVKSSAPIEVRIQGLSPRPTTVPIPTPVPSVSPTGVPTYAPTPVPIPGRVADVDIRPRTGYVKKGTRGMLTTGTAGAGIYFTTDGTEPVMDADGKPAGTTMAYKDAIIVNESVTIRAVAVREGFISSGISEMTYTVSDEDWGDIPYFLRDAFNSISEVPEGLWYAFEEELRAYEQSGSTGLVVAYDGNEQRFNDEIYVFYGNIRLEEGSDYRVIYKNNKQVAGCSDAKAPTVKIKGLNNYNGSASFTFTIAPADINGARIESEKVITVYDGSSLSEIDPLITYNGRKLVKGKDYKLLFSDVNGVPFEDVANSDVATGSYTVSVNALEGSSFAGTMHEKINVKYIPSETPEGHKLVKMSDVNIEIPEVEYTGETVSLEGLFDNSGDRKAAATITYGTQVLQYGVDYLIEEIDPDVYPYYPSAGQYLFTVRGTEASNGTSYVGEKVGTLSIKGIPASEVKVACLDKKPEYTGKVIRLEDLYKDDDTDYKEITLYTLKDGHKVVLGSDSYEVDLSHAAAYGSFEVIFRLKGGYTGTISESVNVKPYNILKDNRNLIGMEISEAEYSKSGAVPGVIVKYGDTLLREGEDYVLKFRNNKRISDEKGREPYVVIKGTGYYKGKVTKTFKVNRKSISDVTLYVPDKTFKANGSKGYFRVLPQVMDEGKALKKRKDYNKFGINDCKFYDAGSGIELTTDDKPVEGSIIRVDVRLSCPETSQYTGDATISGYYRLVGAGKNIKKARVSVVTSDLFIYSGGQEIIPVKSKDLKVTLDGIDLGSEDYDIVSVKNNVFIGTATIELSGKGEYGGTKKVNVRVKKRKFF